MQSRAESPSLRPRKSHVETAEILMLSFGTLSSFGFPVLPLVKTSTVGSSLRHSRRNSS